MIYAISGLLGGGKSFLAVEKMARHIAQGGLVYSNIRLELDPWHNPSYPAREFLLDKIYSGCLQSAHDGKIEPLVRNGQYVYNARGFRALLRQRYGWELQDGQYVYLPDSCVNATLEQHISGGTPEHPVMVVLDEALDHFEAGDGHTDANFRSFLRHVRKLGIDLYFICQDFASLDRKIRALVHYVINVKDMYVWKMPVIGLPMPPPWRNNIHVLEWHAADYGKSRTQPTNRDTWHYRDPLVFGAYSSTGLHRSFRLLDARHDFGRDGLITSKEDVPMWCKLLSLITFCLVVWLAICEFRRPDIDIESLRQEVLAPSGQVSGQLVAQSPAPTQDVPNHKSTHKSSTNDAPPSINWESPCASWSDVDGRIVLAWSNGVRHVVASQSAADSTRASFDGLYPVFRRF